MTNNNIRKQRHKNTPTKQLISTLVARYAAAPAREQKAIVEFFNWTIQNTSAGELQSFYVEVRAKVTEVTAP